MENLLARRQFEELIKQFGEENFNQWPFWQKGAGAFARAQAYANVKAGDKAEADLNTALEFTSDSRSRTSILLTMGTNRELNLNEDASALAAYQQNFESAGRIGSSEQFQSVQGAARILTRQGKFDAALAALQRAEIENLKGTWRHTLLLSKGNTLAAANRTEEALQTFQQIIDDPSAAARHKNKARTEIKGVRNLLLKSQEKLR